MAIPSIPALGSVDWYAYAQGLDTEARTIAGKANTSHTHGVTDLTATGTKSTTTFLRGDNTWAVPAGGGSGTVQALYSNSAIGAVGAGSRAFTAANSMIWVPVNVPVPTTLTGVRIRRGAATVAANVIAALYDATGTGVAVSGAVAEGVGSFVPVSLPFSATYAAAAGVYWVGLIGSSTSADFHGWSVNEYLGPATAATQGSFATPASFTPPALTSVGAVTAPLVLLY